jgi:hypothetical protein
MPDNWEEINDLLEEATKLIKKEGLTMVSATFGTPELNNWQYKIWLPKKHQKKRKLNDKEQPSLK